MRRAFQRCSSSLPRNLSLLSTTSRTAQQCIRQTQTSRTALAASYRITRSLHQSLRRPQEAAAAESSPDTSGNGPITTFKELGTNGFIHPNLIQTLTQQMGIETMTEVQAATINEAIKGTDVIAQAKTGTGKTLAFLLPILQRIINVDPHLADRATGRRGPRTTADDIRGIIISPTRELAEQIAEEASKLTRNTGIIVQTAVGGTQKLKGLRQIQQQGCHLLVGTPGRLKDILTDPYSRVEAPDLSAFVLDEADRLLDQGFWPEIQEIMRLLPTTQEKDRQTMMFSATVPSEVVQLVRSTLKPGFQFVKCVQDDEQPTHERIPQKIVRMGGLENGLPTLVEICQNGIQAAKEPDARPFKAIIYFNSTAEVTLATSTLQNLQLPSGGDQQSFGRGSAHPFGRARILEIHAKLSQGQRTHAAQDFKNCESGMLISSDVTARGMDFPNVTHVIQMGLPTSREQYIHRIGRTGRAGKEGEGWLVLNPMEADEGRQRLRGLPLQKDETLSIPKLDLTKPGDVPASAGRILSMYQQAIQRVGIGEKSKVYLAMLGVHAFVSRKEMLVQAMNNLSQFGWGLREPPFISPALATRLRLRGVPGVRLGEDFGGDRSSGGFNDRSGGRGGGDRFGGRDGGRDAFGGRGGREDRFGGGQDRFGGRGGGGGRGSYSSDRPSYGGPRRDNNFGKPAYNDPFA